MLHVHAASVRFGAFKDLICCFCAWFDQHAAAARPASVPLRADALQVYRKAV